MEEKRQKGDFETKRNKDGSGWRRLKRIGNNDFEKFSEFFSKYTNDDVAPTSLPLSRTRQI